MRISYLNGYLLIHVLGSSRDYSDGMRACLLYMSSGTACVWALRPLAVEYTLKSLRTCRKTSFSYIILFMYLLGWSANMWIAGKPLPPTCGCHGHGARPGQRGWGEGGRGRRWSTPPPRPSVISEKIVLHVFSKSHSIKSCHDGKDEIYGASFDSLSLNFTSGAKSSTRPSILVALSHSSPTYPPTAPLDPSALRCCPSCSSPGKRKVSF